MAQEKYFPFRSVEGDRRYSAEDWADYFALMISNGVFYNKSDSLKVVSDDGMNVKVRSGAGFVEGRMYLLEGDKALTVDTADGVLDRIDRVVLRCDYSNRKISVQIKKGNLSTIPSPKDIERNADVYELVLADIYIKAGVVKISTSDISDQRLNTTVCGIVTGMVKEIDTNEIFNQFQDFMNNFEKTAEEDFNSWFEKVKGQLSTDQAGNLQVQIDEVKESMGGLNIKAMNYEEYKALSVKDENTIYITY